MRKARRIIATNEITFDAAAEASHVFENNWGQATV